jgi:peptidoglycan/LPS O-acetylase OafA/YrhL
LGDEMNKGRLSYLDSIRGIAALLVVFSHFLENTPIHNFLIFKFFTPGQCGVVLFFLLSGFVIPYSLKHSKGSLKRFAISRFFRLYPAYWFSVFLATITAVYFVGSTPSLTTVFANLTMVQSLFRQPDLFGVYWTLLVELAFYFSCAILLFKKLIANLAVRFYFSLALLALSLLSAFIRHSHDINIPVGIILSLSMMFFGSVWREYALDENKSALKFSVVWIVLFILIFPIISVLVYDFDRGHGESAYNYIGSFYVALLAFITLTTKVKISNVVFVFVGLISYSIYLTHPFILYWLSSKFDISSSFDMLVFLFYVVSVLSLASLSYYLIEQPSINLGKVIKQRIATSNAGDARDSI